MVKTRDTFGTLHLFKKNNYDLIFAGQFREALRHTVVVFRALNNCKKTKNKTVFK